MSFVFLQEWYVLGEANVFHLEVSLKGLAQKFGNISSNKDHIGTFVQILQEMRYHIGHGLVSYLIQVIITSVFHAEILIYLVCFVVLQVFLVSYKNQVYK